MRKSILLILFSVCIFTTGYSQRIVKSAIDQYPSYNDANFNAAYEYAFDRTFKLSDGSIVTISTKQYDFSITKWSKDLAVLDKTEIEQTKKEIIYHSFMLDDVIYLFSYGKSEDNKRVHYYYQMSCKDKISIEIKNNNIDGYVVLNKDQYVYMMNADNSGMIRVDIQTLQSQKIAIPVLNTSSKEMDYEVVDGYVVLTYRTENTAKGKEPSNSVIETFIVEAKTSKVNKMSIDFLFDKTKLNDFDVAANNDSIYFITYSNEEKHTIIDYKIIGYDFSSNKSFLQKSSSLEFTKKFYHRFLLTLFFNVDPNTGNIILILDRFHTIARHTSMIRPTGSAGFGNVGVPMGGGFSRTTVYTGHLQKQHIDYPVIYMNPAGDVIHSEYIYWPKSEAIDQTIFSFYPKIIVVDGLVYMFISSFKMIKTTCYVFNSDGTLKDQIILFDKDEIDSNNANSNTITYMGDGLFTFATIPNRFGKTGNYYLIKVYK
jgi:hypothetical protein